MPPAHWLTSANIGGGGGNGSISAAALYSINDAGKLAPTIELGNYRRHRSQSATAALTLAAAAIKGDGGMVIISARSDCKRLHSNNAGSF